MLAVFIIFLMSLVAVIGMAGAINYFLRSGPWRSLGYSFFAVAIFMLFCASGIWEGAPKQDWGWLTPVFALMLVGGWVCLKFGQKIWVWFQKRRK